MKTDQQIYQYMAMGAEAFRVLTGGLILPGPYRFHSVTLKALERRIDGIFEPDGHEGPVFPMEFQGQPSETAWYNLMAKVALYGEKHPKRNIQGILVFLHSSLDQHRLKGIGDDKDGVLRAVYLDHFLPEWLEREPDNPFVAVFAPLVLAAKSALREQAPRLWQAIQNAPLKPDTRETLAKIFVLWFSERFKSTKKQEIWAMLQVLTPIEKTRFYQDILAEGIAKGRVEGETKGMAKGRAKGKAEGKAKGKAEGKAESLKRLLTRRFSVLPDWAAQRIEGASPDQLDAWLDGIFDAESLTGLINSDQH